MAGKKVLPISITVRITRQDNLSGKSGEKARGADDPKFRGAESEGGPNRRQQRWSEVDRPLCICRYGTN